MQHVCLRSVGPAAMGDRGETLLWACPQEGSSLVRANSDE